MPSTINGVGTKYYGKRNCFSHSDYCSHCNRYVEFSSYDTREWFVVLFIPIIPFQKKRIIDFCPSCTWHRAMSLKKYLKGKDEDYTEAMEKYNTDPNDPKAVSGLLEIFGAYQDMESFESLKDEASKNFPDDSTVQAAIGFVYYNHGHMEQARDYLEKSLALKDDEHAHQVLGFVYLRLSEVDNAAVNFQHIIDKRIQNKTGLLFALVDAYQAQGRHQDAIELMDAILDLDPSIANNKNYKKTRKLSEKNLDSGKPTKNRHFVRTQGSRINRTPVDVKKGLFVAGIVALLAFLVYASISFYMGKNANVYLVNGVCKPYEIVLDGQRYSIPQLGFRKIKISEGTKELSVSDENIQIPSETFTLSSSFWKRPFLDRIYVVNPDTIAPLEWSKMYYADPVNLAPEGELKPYMGQMLYVFDGVDFPFKRFPDKVSISGSGPVSRVQVSLVEEDEVPRIQIPDMIEYYLGYEMKVAYLKKIMLYEPEEMMHVYQLYSEGDLDAFIETVRCGLDATPVRVGWHRMYQVAMDIQHPDYDLQTEYKQRLEKMPQDSGMLYLYGRTLTKRKQAREVYQEAIEVTNPTPYAYYALGYDAMIAADYEKALNYFDKTLEIEPENLIFCDCYYEMLVATNQIEKAVAYSKQQMSRNNDDYGWLRKHVDMLRQFGHTDEADQAFQQWLGRNQNAFSPEDLNLLRRSDKLSRVYANGDFKRIRSVIGEPNELQEQILLTLNNRDAISDELMSKSDDFSPMWMLLFYISETHLGNKNDAELFLKEASKRFRAGGHYQRYIADCLMMETKIDVQDILDLPMDIQTKAVVLTALGFRYPEYRQQFFDLAKRLNYKKVFPYHYLNSVYEQFSEEIASNTDITSG